MIVMYIGLNKNGCFLILMLFKQVAQSFGRSGVEDTRNVSKTPENHNQNLNLIAQKIKKKHFDQSGSNFDFYLVR